MNLAARIQSFSTLGKILSELSDDEFQSIAEGASMQNPWFVKANVRMALNGVIKLLSKEKLERWVAPYIFPENVKKVAVIMAGNIPFVGFHDFLSVLISGHSIIIKLSSKDTFLIKFIIEKLVTIAPAFKERIEIAEQLKNFDAVIATGSDNTARYFNYYFGKYPHIIRKNRTSVAILDGTETDEEVKAIGIDVFSYFGLGCRNVSKFFLPAGYAFEKIYTRWESYHDIIHHHKYCNNYDYQKSIMLVNTVPFLDNGFVMLHENTRMVSPISVIYYEFYNSKNELEKQLEDNKEKIQCIVGKNYPATVQPGQAQYPDVTDYADQVDTLQFLTFSS